MSFILDGTTYTGVNFTDDCGFEEMPGATLNVDAWGMDTLTRRYQGRADQLETFISANFKRKRNVRDAVYSALAATEWTATHNGPDAILAVTFKGLFDGKTPDPIVAEDGTRAASVQLQRMSAVIGTLTGQTMTANYYQPYVTVNYVTRQKPLTPQHRGKLDFRGDALDLFGHTGFIGNVSYFKGKLLAGGTSPSQRSTLTGVVSAYNAVIEIYTPVFRRKPVGQWFENTETHEARIVPLEGYNLAGIGNI